jgi:hypothetical protein
MPLLPQNQSIKARAGATTFPECDAQFEIDDRLECVFGDTDNIRLPAIGAICTSCGLLQADSHQNCLCCVAVIFSALN